MESRRLERESRRSQKSPGPKSAAGSSRPPLGGMKNTAGRAADTSPNRGPGKFGGHSPPTIAVPHPMSPLLPISLPQKQGSAAAAAAEYMRRRSLGDVLGRVESREGTARRGSIASTRRSILSFVSARSTRSIGEGDGDGFDLYPQNVLDSDESAETGGGSGSGSGSGTDSDLEEFFDAMTDADEGMYLVVVFQARHIR